MPAIAIAQAAPALAHPTGRSGVAGVRRASTTGSRRRRHVVPAVTVQERDRFGGPVVRPLVPTLARSTVGRYVMDGVFVARPQQMPAARAADDAIAFFDPSHAVFAILAEKADFTQIVPLDVGVTIAWGAKDRILPPSQLSIARQRVPHARFVLLPGCGHVPMTDAPGLVATVLLDGSTIA